jgi:hypothetical protein
MTKKKISPKTQHLKDTDRKPKGSYKKGAQGPKN